MLLESTACYLTYMQWTDDTAYFARAVIYVCNIFMKSTTGVNVKKTFLLLTGWKIS